MVITLKKECGFGAGTVVQYGTPNRKNTAVRTSARHQYTLSGFPFEIAGDPTKENRDATKRTEPIGNLPGELTNPNKQILIWPNRRDFV